MKHKSPSLLFIISGPAGCGKTTLCDSLLKNRSTLQRVVTSTTRAPRPGEQHQSDYYFFDEEIFLKKVAAGDFYEHAKVHSHHYGTLRSEILNKLHAGSDLLLNIDVQGAATFRQATATDPLLNNRVVTIFLMPPSTEELESRLRGRASDSEEAIRLRLQTAEKEMELFDQYDFCLTSSDRASDLNKLTAIYEAEKMRVRSATGANQQ